MNPLGFALLGILLPATLAGAVALGAWRPMSRAPDDAPGTGSAAAAAGVAAAAVLGQGLLFGWPRWPVIETYGWQAWLALAAGVIALTEGALPRRGGRAAAWVSKLAACSAFAWAWLDPVRASYEWTAADVHLRAAIAGGLGTTAWILAEWGAGSNGTRSAAALTAWALAAAGASYAVLRVHYAVGAQLLGITAGVLGAAASIGLWQPRRAAGRGAAGVGSALTAGVLFTARYYPDDPMPWAAVALFLAAPLCAALPLGRGRAGLLARAAAAALPVAAAVGVVVRAVPEVAGYGY